MKTVETRIMSSRKSCTLNLENSSSVQLLKPHKHCCLGPCHVGLVVKVSVWRAADPGFESHFLCGYFSVLSHTSDLKIGAPVATLPGILSSRVSTGTGWPGISIL